MSASAHPGRGEKKKVLPPLQWALAQANMSWDSIFFILLWPERESVLAHLNAPHSCFHSFLHFFFFNTLPCGCFRPMKSMYGPFRTVDTCKRPGRYCECTVRMWMYWPPDVSINAFTCPVALCPFFFCLIFFYWLVRASHTWCSLDKNVCFYCLCKFPSSYFGHPMLCFVPNK